MMTIGLVVTGTHVAAQAAQADALWFYDLDHGRLVRQTKHPWTPAQADLARRLADAQADVLLYGAMAVEWMDQLNRCGIMLFGGVTGDAEQAAQAFANGTLEFSAEKKTNEA